ncbi:hypothetical protein HPB51_006058 [Rhipicephalus microplus]|uniref:Uncharacterized protein n=1 Tax=Rhipicephalus microplus TaxID=6941 RepID=A0A9J6DZL2_RHIMP|nr:hypothetical protein HPB51_006058 [Rhipicephalus microplus]
MAHLKITQLKIAQPSCAMAVYSPTPDNSFRGIILDAHSFESDDQIFNQLRARNPTIDFVSAQRLGKITHFVLTIAGYTLTKHVRYLAFTLFIFPFRERVEVCFDRRQTGHKTDVCLKPKHDNGRRCGESYPQPTHSKELTCPAKCIVCKGGRLTGSRNSKYPFLKRKLPGNDKSTVKATQHLSDCQIEGTTTDNKSYQESFPPLGGRSISATRPDNGFHSRSTSRTPVHHNRLPAVPRAKSVAWQTGKQRQPQTQPFENQQIRKAKYEGEKKGAGATKSPVLTEARDPSGDRRASSAEMGSRWAWQQKDTSPDNEPTGDESGRTATRQPVTWASQGEGDPDTLRGRLLGLQPLCSTFFALTPFEASR